MAHAQSPGDFPQPGSAGREEAAQQPACRQLLQLARASYPHCCPAARRYPPARRRSRPCPRETAARCIRPAAGNCPARIPRSFLRSRIQPPAILDRTEPEPFFSSGLLLTVRVVTIIDNVPIKIIDAQRQRGSLLKDRSVPLLIRGTERSCSLGHQRRCEPLGVRPTWPVCSSDSSTSPSRSFLTASKSHSLVRVSAWP